MKKLIGYFFNGLLFVLPVGITIYIIVKLVSWINELLNIGYPGLGILLAFVGITLVGFLVSSLLGRALFNLFDKTLSRLPLVKIIYTSLKDLIEAFVGEKKKFTEPVLVDYTETGVQVLGFVTRDDLSQIGAEGKLAVYLPYSYSFTGHLIIVPADKVTRIQANSTEIMKFLVSAGVTGL